MAPGNPQADAHTEHGAHLGALDHHGCGLLARLGEGAGFVGLYLERKPSMPTRMRDGSGALHPDGLSGLTLLGWWPELILACGGGQAGLHGFAVTDGQHPSFTITAADFARGPPKVTESHYPDCHSPEICMRDG